MAIRRPPTTFSDTISTADIADDAISGDKLANDIAISTTGNIATTGSGTLTVAGASTFSGGIANSGTISAGTIGTSVTGFGLITHCEMWRVTTNWTGSNSSGAQPVENWELADTYNYSSHGSSVWSWDETNDAFTCSQTGIWRIDFRLTNTDGGGSTTADQFDPCIRTCTDWNGSSGTWSVVTAGMVGDYGVSYAHSDVNVMYLWNLRNTSTHALQFLESFDNSVHSSHDFMGNSTKQSSGAIFTRIGDKVG